MLLLRQGCARAGCGAAVRHVHASVPGRTGALGIKAGMMSEFDADGMRHEMTVLALDNCQVVQVKTRDQNGYSALQLGTDEVRAKVTTKPLMGHFTSAGVAPKRVLGEFRVAPEALLPVGTAVTAAHFVPGQLVDVSGTSKGKGFQGAMKRHNFSGQRATHGVSKAHRALGSTGQCQDPGRVFKGKKMPGRMGGRRTTMQNLTVYRVDEARNLVFVKGHVPGNAGGFVRITDAVKGPKFPTPPPFPTHFATPPEGSGDAESASANSASAAPSSDGL